MLLLRYVCGLNFVPHLLPSLFYLFLKVFIFDQESFPRQIQFFLRFIVVEHLELFRNLKILNYFGAVPNIIIAPKDVYVKIDQVFRVAIGKELGTLDVLISLHRILNLDERARVLIF